MITTLTSMKNPLVQEWKSLKNRQDRENAGVFLVEGEKMTAEALALGGHVQAVLLDEKKQERFAFALSAPCPVYLLPEHVLAAVVNTKTPQGVAALVSLPPVPEQMGKRLVALDGVQDPGNVGTILRTADAAGYDGVLVTEACADVFSPKCLRATMGSIYRMPVKKCKDLPEELTALKAQGYSILSSELGGAPFYKREALGEKLVLIIGNEGNGVSDAVSQTATHKLALPMVGGAESLNAAIAAGIMMYDLQNR